MFLVKWQGYDNEDNTWEPLKNFDINQLVTEQKSQLVYGAEKIVGHRMVMGKVNEQKLRKKKTNIKKCFNTFEFSRRRNIRSNGLTTVMRVIHGNHSAISNSVQVW